MTDTDMLDFMFMHSGQVERYFIWLEPLFACTWRLNPKNPIRQETGSTGMRESPREAVQKAMETQADYEKTGSYGI